MIIYIARHGQTTGDIEDRYGGDYDDHLTALGQKQAQQLAKLLKNKGIEKILTSPRIRAKETAEFIAEELAVGVSELNDFRERNRYGLLTGMVKSDATKKYPRQANQVKDIYATIDGAEPYIDFRKRIFQALKEITNLPSKKILIVSHGGPIKLIYKELLELGMPEVEDCGYIVLEVTNDNKLNLIKQNGISAQD
jgi:broad specificity phosphatase PhoE